MPGKKEVKENEKESKGGPWELKTYATQTQSVIYDADNDTELNVEQALVEILNDLYKLKKGLL